MLNTRPVPLDRTPSPDQGADGSSAFRGSVGDGVGRLLANHVHRARNEEARNAREDRGVDDSKSFDSVDPEIRGEHAAVLTAADAAGTRRVVTPRVPLDELRQLRIANAFAWQLLGGDEPFGLQS